MIIKHLENGKFNFVMLDRCISSKNFEETRFIYSASENIEIFMGTDTDEVIDILFDTMLQRFQEAIETSSKKGSEFILKMLIYYIIIFIE